MWAPPFRARQPGSDSWFLHLPSFHRSLHCCDHGSLLTARQAASGSCPHLRPTQTSKDGWRGVAGGARVVQGALRVGHRCASAAGRASGGGGGGSGGGGGGWQWRRWHHLARALLHTCSSLAHAPVADEAGRGPVLGPSKRWGGQAHSRVLLHSHVAPPPPVGASLAQTAALAPSPHLPSPCQPCIPLLAVVYATAFAPISRLKELKAM